MSVLMLDLKVFSYIHEGLKKTAYNNTVDIFFSHTINQYFKDKDIEEESKRLVKAWINLNEESYDVRYEEDQEEYQEEGKLLSCFYREYSHKEPVKAIQLLKFIQCLIYNIEIEEWESTEQENKDYNLLKKWEVEMLTSIVGSTEEYKNAKWGNL